MIKYAKVINNETKQCEVGTGTNAEFYKSIGMSEMDVEQSYNGQWYLQGYAPKKVATKAELSEFIYQEKCKVAYGGISVNIDGDLYIFETNHDSITMCNSRAYSLMNKPDDYIVSWKVYKNNIPVMINLTKVEFLSIFNFGSDMIDQAFVTENELNDRLLSFTDDLLADSEYIQTFKDYVTECFNIITTTYVLHNKTELSLEQTEITEG